MSKIKKLTFAGVCLAACMVLPLLTAQIPQIAQAISPMHIPVLICGFICGWPLGLAVGFIAPFLRFGLFGMPVIFPMGISMAFELATYGFVAGILYKMLPKKIPYVYVTLIISMLIGRIVWGVAFAILMGIAGNTFTFDAFIAAAFTSAIPGIIIHIVIIPVIVVALKKAGLMANE